MKSDLDRTDLSKKKTGVFTGRHAINPVNKKPIPIWVADYVLMGYGTGAIMSVPAHDTRDFEFAKEFNIPVVCILDPEVENRDEILAGDACWTEDGKYINSASEVTGLNINGLNKEAGIKRLLSGWKHRVWGVQQSTSKCVTAFQPSAILGRAISCNSLGRRRSFPAG